MKSKLGVVLGTVVTLVVLIIPYYIIQLPSVSKTNTYSHWWLPDATSTYAPKIDGLFDFIMWLTMIVFVLVEFCFVWFLMKYAYAPGRKAKYYHGNNKVEIIWTAVPALILAFLAIFSNSLWSEMKYPAQYPQNAEKIRIKPRQFQWDITYPGVDKKFDTEDDINTVNQLFLVNNEPAQIILQAQDVIHSFFVPEFRIKQDAVPGMTTSVWIQPTKNGSYEIACAELCGGQHYRMKGYVTVGTRDSLAAWLEEQK
jgi:cytochrome c oxidase subunit II